MDSGSGNLREMAGRRLQLDVKRLPDNSRLGKGEGRQALGELWSLERTHSGSTVKASQLKPSPPPRRGFSEELVLSFEFSQQLFLFCQHTEFSIQDFENQFPLRFGWCRPRK